MVHRLLHFHAMHLLPPTLVARDSIADNLPALPGAGFSCELPAEEALPRAPAEGDGDGWFSGLFSGNAAPSPEALENERRVRNLARESVGQCRVSDIFDNSTQMGKEALVHLVEMLVTVSSETSDEDGSALCLDLTARLTVLNQGRLELLWPRVFGHFESVCLTVNNATLTLERAVFNLLRLALHVLERQPDKVIKILEVLNRISKPAKHKLGDTLISGMQVFLRSAVLNDMKTPEGWNAIFSLLSDFSHHPSASAGAFKCLELIAGPESHLVSWTNYMQCLTAAEGFAVDTPQNSKRRAGQALDLMVHLYLHLLNMRGKEHMDSGLPVPMERLEEEWAGLWMESLQRMLRFAAEDSREQVRFEAIACTQRAIFIEESRQLTPDQWRSCFDDAFFPTLDVLFQKSNGTVPGSPAASPAKQAAVQISAAAAEHWAELRMQCFQLITRTFLHKMQMLVRLPHFEELWRKTLSFFERFIEKGEVSQNSPFYLYSFPTAIELVSLLQLNLNHVSHICTFIAP